MTERQDIRFESRGINCSGWFYRAEKAEESPCIVMAHGFGGTKEMRLDAYAETFAAAGYNCLVFDYRHFGSSEGEPRQILDINKQHQDWHAAVRFAKGMPGVDAGRIILWGTSFSGGHVIPVALEESGIAAVISQVPHLDGTATALAAGPIQNFKLAVAAVRDLLRKALHRSPYYVPVVGQPGELAAMTAPDAEAGMKNLCPDGFMPDERVAARIFLNVGLYSPARLASELNVPWLVQVAAQDLTTPVKPAIKAVKKAPEGQLIIYKCGHFDIYLPPRFDHAVADQLTFLKHHLK